MSTGRARLAGRTIAMSGGSRGIGLPIALRAAADGANVVLSAKTDAVDPRLEGTVHSAAAQIGAAGGQATAVVADVRKDEDVERAVSMAVERFGGVDMVVDNASALDLRQTSKIDMKKYDLMLFFIDEDVLAQEGITDLAGYRAAPGGGALTCHLFLDA